MTEEEKEGEWKDCFPSPNNKAIVYIHVRTLHIKCVYTVHLLTTC